MRRRMVEASIWWAFTTCQATVQAFNAYIHYAETSRTDYQRILGLKCQWGFLRATAFMLQEPARCFPWSVLQVYQSPRAAVTKHHRLGGFKQQKLTVSQSEGLKSRWQQGHALWAGARGGSFLPLPAAVLPAPCWALACCCAPPASASGRAALALRVSTLCVRISLSFLLWRRQSLDSGTHSTQYDLTWAWLHMQRLIFPNVPSRVQDIRTWAYLFGGHNSTHNSRPDHLGGHPPTLPL